MTFLFETLKKLLSFTGMKAGEGFRRFRYLLLPSDIREGTR